MVPNSFPAAQHVMVLYTGGTIGMQASEHGLAPASGFEARMREYLHSQPELVVPQWRFREMSPLIDSANMSPAYWQQLREAVVDAVDVQGCDSVLILHGTDTLAYSAAAMSFQLLDRTPACALPADPAGRRDRQRCLGKPRRGVGGVGSGPGTGRSSLLPWRIRDPTGCAKVRSFGRHPFKRLERQGGGAKASSLPAALNYNQSKRLAVAVLPLFPGIGAEQLDGVLNSGIQGLVLECYGSGTGLSDNPEFFLPASVARDNGVVVVAVTQCHEGGVELDVYEARSPSSVPSASMILASPSRRCRRSTMC